MALAQEAISSPRPVNVPWSNTWVPKNNWPSPPWLMIRRVSSPVRLAKALLIWLTTSCLRSKVTTEAFVNSCCGTVSIKSEEMITRLFEDAWKEKSGWTVGVSAKEFTMIGVGLILCSRLRIWSRCEPEALRAFLFWNRLKSLWKKSLKSLR